MTVLSRALVFVPFRPVSAHHGHVCAATAAFAEEVRDGGPAISDHNMPMPDRPGLVLFEGWVEVGAGEDPDVSWVGEWRPLSHWEMSRVRHGLPPWDDTPNSGLEGAGS